jgi:dienelactone hydrolase
MEAQTSQSEDLASHGYIVAAIDHTYASAATAFPDRVVSAREATANFDVAEPAEIITRIMAEDASFVIDQLSEMNEGSITSIFLGRMNMEQIGVVGHSVGGAVAYNLAINEPRVKAAIDLDGVVFLTPHAGAREMTPFLMLANDQYHVQAIQERKSLMENFDEVPDAEQNILRGMYGSQEAYQAAYEKARQNVIGLAEVLKASGNLYTIAGSDHLKFTDIGLWFGFRPLRELINIRGATDPKRCLEITKAVTLAFFDQHLKGENSAALEALVKAYPELKNVTLK